MSPKRIAFYQDAREGIRHGVNKLARTVRSTLGPRGRNVIIERSFGSPLVTKDGVTVAREVHLEDKLENVGARMVREVASKTNDVAGDGTTTATVLADAIFTEGLKAVVAGVRPEPLRAGIEKAVTDIVGLLKAKSIPAKRPQRNGTGRRHRGQQQLHDRRCCGRSNGQDRQMTAWSRSKKARAAKPPSNSWKGCSSTGVSCLRTS